MSCYRLRLGVAAAAASVALTGAVANAQAAVSVTSSAGAITVTGGAGTDVLALTAVTTEPDGDHIFRLSDATVAGGTACTQDGSGAVCNDNASAGAGGVRALDVDLGAGADNLDNRSQVGGDFDGQAGGDLLRSAPVADVPSTLRGGDDNDVFAVGAGLGADSILGGNGDDFVDYLERGAGQLGGNVLADRDDIADDGGLAEGDNVASTVEAIRGTRQAGDNLTAPLADGDLGADTLNATTIVYELTTVYARPPGAARTSGVTVDLATGANSDGDTLGMARANVVGTRFAEKLDGSGAANRIEGRGGADTIRGLGSPDAINTSDVSGGVTVAGRLQFASGSDPVSLDGGVGDDRMLGDAGADTLRGGDGADALSGVAGDDVLDGGPGPDRLDGGDGSDTVTYAAATAAVRAALGSQTAFSPPAASSELDEIVRAENLIGGALGDTLTGNDDGNRIEGGNGNDRIDDGKRTGAADADALVGGDGSDTLDYSQHADTLAGAGSVIDLSEVLPRALGDAGLPEDVTTGFENAVGTPRKDWLIGSDNSNLLQGGGGNDLLQGNGGADILAGEDGARDLAGYGERSAGVTVSFAGGIRPDGDLYTGIEGACGTQGPDVLIGTDAAEGLAGLGGDDELNGAGGDDDLGGDSSNVADGPAFAGCAPAAAGDDLLNGGRGADRMNGGEGEDRVSYEGETFVVRASLGNAPFDMTNSQGDSFGSIENLTGGNAGDILLGGVAANDIDGGPGDDRIDGGGGDDTLSGGTGNDQIRPFTNAGNATVPVPLAETSPTNDGEDSISGDAGNDTLDSRDARADDPVDCGTGTDTAVIDLTDPGSETNCETQQRGQVDVHPMQRLTNIRRSGRRLRATIVCPRVRSRRVRRSCRGRMTVRAKAKGRRLGSRRYAVRQGRSKRVTLRLRRRATRRAVIELVEVQRNQRKRTTTVRLR